VGHFWERHSHTLNSVGWPKGNDRESDELEAMRATSVMRYVVLGAIGFGVGWAVAGLFNTALVALTEPVSPPGRGAEPPPGWATWPPYFAYCLGGAFGGAGLGLAIGSWKRVVALTVAGGVGFGLSLFVFFIVAFLSGLPGVGVAIGVGLFGGVVLGLTFGDWKRVVLLGVGGLVGFGIGGAIAAALGMPVALYPFFVEFIELWQAPMLLLQHLLVQAMVGLIGGASLGAALGYLEQRRLAEERSPRVR
jgi:hypothetical protein